MVKPLGLERRTKRSAPLIGLRADRKLHGRHYERHTGYELGPYATPTLRESRTNQGLSSPAKTVDIADLPRNCSVIIRPTERLMTEVQEPAQGNGFSVAF